MENVKLSPHETILYQGAYRTAGGNKEMVITSKSIYNISRGTFSSKIKKLEKIPLDDILKDENGAPQVFFQKLTMGYNTNILNIYHKNGNTQIKFENVIDAIDWIEKIHSVIAPDGVERIPSGDEERAKRGPLGDIAGMVANVYGLGIKKRIAKQPLSKRAKKVTVHCKSCSAPITGIKGAQAKCEYCGAQQEI